MSISVHIIYKVLRQCMCVVVFQTRTVLDLVAISSKNFKPPWHLSLGVLKIGQPTQRSMVDSYCKLPAIHVMSIILCEVHNSQQFPPSDTIASFLFGQAFAAVGNYFRSWPFWTWDKTAPMPQALASVSRMNSSFGSGYTKIGAFVNQCFNSHQASSCSMPHLNSWFFSVSLVKGLA